MSVIGPREPSAASCNVDPPHPARCRVPPRRVEQLAAGLASGGTEHDETEAALKADVDVLSASGLPGNLRRGRPERKALIKDQRGGLRDMPRTYAPQERKAPRP